MKGSIPGCDPEAWRKVATLVDPLEGKSKTGLTLLITDAKGSDQMAMSHIRTFFSKKVAVSTILIDTAPMSF